VTKIGMPAGITQVGKLAGKVITQLHQVGAV
jgi:hypothetical protein